MTGTPEACLITGPFLKYNLIALAKARMSDYVHRMKYNLTRAFKEKEYGGVNRDPIGSKYQPED